MREPDWMLASVVVLGFIALVLACVYESTYDARHCAWKKYSQVCQKEKKSFRRKMVTPRLNSRENLFKWRTGMWQ